MLPRFITLKRTTWWNVFIGNSKPLYDVFSTKLEPATFPHSSWTFVPPGKRSPGNISKVGLLLAEFLTNQLKSKEVSDQTNFIVTPKNERDSLDSSRASRFREHFYLQGSCNFCPRFIRRFIGYALTRIRYFCTHKPHYSQMSCFK